jgi:nitrate reductase / nitrite oxidoreductase, beta subunit
MEAARRSPVYKMAIDWKIAFPLHPEYRTLPMVWYVPPLSPIQNAHAKGQMGTNGVIPDVSSLRIPLTYLANLLTGGNEAPVKLALERMLGMRAYKREQQLHAHNNSVVLRQTGLTEAMVEEMYRYLAIANYEDRYVIPSSHREYAGRAFDIRSNCGFSFGNGCSNGDNNVDLFGKQRKANLWGGTHE